MASYMRPEHAGGVGHRLLVPHLRSRRVEVGDVGALVVGGDLERRAGAGRGLLEDQRDLLACQPRISVPAYLAIFSAWEGSGGSELVGSKSISLRKLRLSRLYLVSGSAPSVRSVGGVALDGAGHAVGAAPTPAELEALDGDDLDAGLAAAAVLVPVLRS